MVTALRDQKGVIFNGVYQSVTTIDSAGPEPCQLVLEGFWLTNACKMLSLNITDKQIDPFENCLVGRLPVKVIFPCCC